MKERILKLIDELIAEYTPTELTDTERDYSEGEEALKKLREKVSQLEPLVMQKIGGIVQYSKQGNRNLALMGLLIIGSVTYSPTAKLWYAKLYNIADITAEYETEQECNDLIQNEANEFLRRCLIAEE